LGLAAAAYGATTLTCSVAEVLWEGVVPGKKAVLSRVLRAPLRVRYSGPAGMVLRVEPVRPTPEETKAGYEPIPDPRWIRVLRPRTVLPSSPALLETDVEIRLPRRAAHWGRRYQAHLRIWAESPGHGRRPVSVALENRLLIVTAERR
jgi:hypothetical protein